jgi:hypothetical protein
MVAKNFDEDRFFRRLDSYDHIPCANVFVECKNHTSDPATASAVIDHGCGRVLSNSLGEGKFVVDLDQTDLLELLGLRRQNAYPPDQRNYGGKAGSFDPSSAVRISSALQSPFQTLPELTLARIVGPMRVRLSCLTSNLPPYLVRSETVPCEIRQGAVYGKQNISVSPTTILSPADH